VHSCQTIVIKVNATSDINTVDSCISFLPRGPALKPTTLLLFHVSSDQANASMPVSFLPMIN
jgi:hypothetical protein